MKTLLVVLALSLCACAQTACNLNVAADGTVTLLNCAPPVTPPYSAQVSFNPIFPNNADNIYSSATRQWLGSASDGPASGPQQTMNTMSYLTPSPGAVTPVQPGGLQASITAAQCGDTLQLAPGTYDYSKMQLVVNKPCDVAHWITIVGPVLPPEGTRTGPAVNTAQVLLDSIHGVNFSGTAFMRIEGVEFTRAAGTGQVTQLLPMAGSHDVIFDRNWIHGSAKDETRHGVTLNDSYNIALVDNYLNDFKCFAGGMCNQATAISGGNNSVTTYTGNYKVVNNYIEAAGEGIIFGGGGSVSTSCDIEVRLNYFSKPLNWMPPVGSTSVAGYAVVENDLELKNAARVFIESNIFENSWGGFSQNGFLILLSPKNPQGTAPGAQVHDVILRKNWLRHAGGGMQITTTQSSPTATSAPTSSLGMWQVAIHDNLIEDIENSAKLYGASGTGFQVTKTDPNGAFDKISVTHNTFVKGSKTIFNVGSQKYGTNLDFSGNVLDAGLIGICGKTATCQVVGTGNGTSDCSYGWSSSNPAKTLNACWQPYSFTGNAILSGWGTWPAGTILTTPAAAGFVDYANGDYHLMPASPLYGLGADIDGVKQAVQNIQ